MTSLAVMANILMVIGMVVTAGAIYLAMFKKGAKISEKNFFKFLSSGLLISATGSCFAFFAEGVPTNTIINVCGIMIFAGFIGFSIFCLSFWFWKRRIMRDAK